MDSTIISSNKSISENSLFNYLKESIDKRKKTQGH